jgi:hypothetical protein
VAVGGASVAITSWIGRLPAGAVGVAVAAAGAACPRAAAGGGAGCAVGAAGPAGVPGPGGGVAACQFGGASLQTASRGASTAGGAGRGWLGGVAQAAAASATPAAASVTRR